MVATTLDVGATLSVAAKAMLLSISFVSCKDYIKAHYVHLVKFPT
jgi:hypothetical protein